MYKKYQPILYTQFYILFTVIYNIWTRADHIHINDIELLTKLDIVYKIIVLLLAVFVLALPKTFAKTCSHVLPHNGLKFGTSQDAKL